LFDLQKGDSAGIISAKFHNTLTEIIVAVACKVGEPRVLLTGGCFQNRILIERSVRRLSEAGFQPYWHQRVPPNDGGIALGQTIAAARSSPEVKRSSEIKTENNYVSGHSWKAR
jgi:hydrogenase maturation protein HypF